MFYPSRAEVEKQRMNSTIKSQQFDDSKNEYANQLQKTNESQVSKYEQGIAKQIHLPLCTFHLFCGCLSKAGLPQCSGLSRYRQSDSVEPLSSLF